MICYDMICSQLASKRVVVMWYKILSVSGISNLTLGDPWRQDPMSVCKLTGLGLTALLSSTSFYNLKQKCPQYLTIIYKNVNNDC